MQGMDAMEQGSGAAPPYVYNTDYLDNIGMGSSY